jgi:alkanesulfonate monooxygenase
MTSEFYWRLPTEGDARIGTLGLRDLSSVAVQQAGYFPQASGHRHADRSTLTYLDYLARVAKAAETAGFAGVLVPDSPAGEEPWIVAGALLRETRRLRFLASFHTAIVKPVHAARASATYQRHSGNRFDWNIVSGENDRIQRRYGDFASLDERYRRTGEFIDIARGVLSHREFSYEGTIYQVDKGGLQPPIANVALPTVHLSGASDVALDVAASRADVYVTWLEPVETLRPKIARLLERASGYGRRLTIGVRVDVIARPSEADAWAEARRLWETTDKLVLRQRQQLTGDDIDSAVGERAYATAYAAKPRFEDSVIGPNLWASEGLVRPGPAVAIVGDYAQVAAVIDTYRAIDVERFFLAAPPHLDEAYRIGEEVLPLLQPAQQAAE